MGQSIIPPENSERRARCNKANNAVRKDDEVEVLDLSPEDSLIVAEALLRPPKISSALARAFARHRQSVISE